MTPQERLILNHCVKVGYITPRAARDDYGIEALPRRIADLKARGYEFQRELRKNPGTGQRYARYHLKGQPT